MKNRHLLLALLLVVIVNVIVLSGVYLNRKGVSEAILTLNERELTVQKNRENSGVSLRLDWNRYSGAKPWFDEQTLSDFGFNVEAIKASADDQYHWRKVLPRKGHVVLEYAGEAWRAWLLDAEKEILRLEQEAETETDENERDRIVSRISRKKEQLETNSRLFAVDVGADPKLLRQQYPDRTRFAVVGARVRVNVSYADNNEPLLQGAITNLLVETIHVAKSQQTPFADSMPEFKAAVHWGQRYEPWIESIVKR